ncbi:endopeptidase La [Halothermothrix orenii]|uniref:Lon protease n=1 Tax=Halothermothrix orenii (strain H 168 / OCM 544 / DSM 9562) TaxID=373903 RepID=LON_HALOH|nr:endopeptidase La [Halothermothrix orenii]B8CY71.1 RecName: Full=Lon protease; AltName: Full=ATP-dependent protease La [Halothermothrix orenii H 168]ACL70240.1 ATP-dependent protease La [Halothermothrix orenii H 168]
MDQEMVTKETEKYIELPLLASRGVVVFPHMVIPLLVGREKSIEALEKAMVKDKEIIILSQKDEKIEDPDPEDLYTIGTIAEVKQLVKLPNGMLKVVVEGIKRARIIDFIEIDEYFEVRAEILDQTVPEVDLEMKALMKAVLNKFQEYIKYNRNLPSETIMTVTNIEEPARFSDTIASHLELKFRQEQDLLEAISIKERLNKLLEIIKDEIEILKVEQKIQKKVRKQVEKTQKEYYLREQLKAIKEELDEDEEDDEIEEYRNKAEELDLPEKIREKVDKEIEKLKKTPSMSPEATVIRNYLDCVLDLPWNKVREEKIDLDEAKNVLDSEHYGLEDVKERILEYLAVRKLAPQKKSPILCLIGAPGVGKTSLGRSIARALGRDFVRLSLGGVRDEAEIRGHRRTYIGSRPGRIINAMREAGSKNPVFLLDEVDKMSSDFRGDPAAALLEVLDPEQNNEFTDHYLELPFDLSKVLFVTTANVAYPIPAPLLDRMEVIELPGYTEDEKVEIALRHLIPRILNEHGLTEDEIHFSSNSIYRIIREYTREAGVRNLERKLAAITRKVSKEIVEGRGRQARVTTQSIEKYLGVPKFKYEKAQKKDRVGVATGMAYTQTGGDILDIEVAVVPGKGKLTLTGSLGDVMKESARAALSYIRSKQEELGLSDNFHEEYDLHVHVPKGATPKDGPSAGITIASAIASALTGQPVKGKYAMTGEVTLRGRVLPVGGIKTKIMAARRAGLKDIIMPEENKKDFEEIPVKIKKDIRVNFVNHMDQVLDLILGGDEDEN